MHLGGGPDGSCAERVGHRSSLYRDGPRTVAASCDGSPSGPDESAEELAPGGWDLVRVGHGRRGASSGLGLPETAARFDQDRDGGGWDVMLMLGYEHVFG